MEQSCCFGVKMSNGKQCKTSSQPRSAWLSFLGVFRDRAGPGRFVCWWQMIWVGQRWRSRKLLTLRVLGALLQPHLTAATSLQTKPELDVESRACG